MFNTLLNSIPSRSADKFHPSFPWLALFCKQGFVYLLRLIPPFLLSSFPSLLPLLCFYFWAKIVCRLFLHISRFILASSGEDYASKYVSVGTKPQSHSAEKRGLDKRTVSSCAFTSPRPPTPPPPLLFLHLLHPSFLYSSPHSNSLWFHFHFPLKKEIISCRQAERGGLVTRQRHRPTWS